MNILATKNLGWQQRKAEAFICTPLFTGGDRVGYRPSSLFASGLLRRSAPRSDEELQNLGIRLGTAMAISGAAVSPNWGYHSSPITSFLMMLANVRLGWWFGNPKKGKKWRRIGPISSLGLFVQEALGWTDEDQPWIYLSDGGHFENLGLYEMIRRRCRTIVVSDAGADPNCTLQDLGNAVRKIFVDFGVRIEFSRIHLRKRSVSRVAGVYCALGEIRYPEGCNGKIVYIKPGFYGTKEPADVRAYAAAHAKFPHESTLNQWFNESQFESYRALGEFVIDELCGGSRQGKHDDEMRGLEQFVRRVESYLRKFDDDPVPDGATLVAISRAVEVQPAKEEHAKGPARTRSMTLAN